MAWYKVQAIIWSTDDYDEVAEDVESSLDTGDIFSVDDLSIFEIVR